MSDLHPFIAVMQRESFKSFIGLQALDDGAVVRIIGENLPVAQTIHKFLGLFNGDFDSNSDHAEFCRGFLVGCSTIVMVENDQSKLEMTMDQIMLMIVMLTAKDIDILTGLPLKAERERRKANVGN